MDKSNQLKLPIEPIIKLCQIIGLCPFSVTKKFLKKSKVRCMYPFGAILLYGIMAVYNLFNCVTLLDRNIFRITTMTNFVVCILYLFTAWTVGIFYQSEHIQLILDIHNFDKKFKELFGSNINYQHTKIFFIGNIICCSIVATATIIKSCLSLGEVISSPYVFIILYTTYNIPIIISFIICTLMMTYVYIIKERSNSLNCEVEKLKQFPSEIRDTKKVFRINVSMIETKKSTHRVMILRNISVLHHHLSGQIILLSETFGILLLALFGYSFNIIIFEIYSFFYNNHIAIWHKAVNFFTTTLFAADIILFCHMCDTAIKKVNQTGILLHKIETEEPELRDELVMFSLQIANEKVEFDAAGFFSINYTLIFSIIGGVTTYIIILMQLGDQ